MNADVALSVLREALSSLSAHPLRSALTALSVTFGAAVLLVLLSYGTSMPDTTSDMLRSMGSREFVVEPERRGGSRGRRIQIRYVDLPAIHDACPSIATIAPVYSTGRGGPVFATHRSWPWARISGVGSDYKTVTELRVVEGRWFLPQEEELAEEVALISLPLRDGLYDGYSPMGEVIDAGGRRFRIIGVFESQSVFAYSLFVPYTTAMEMGDTGGRFVSEIAFQPRSQALATEAIDEIKQALGTLYSFDADDPRTLEIKENTGFAAKVEAVSMALEWLVLTIAGVALVLGCLGAANVVGIAVAERTSELGLRKALGAPAGRIRAEVLAETLMLCLAGGVIGIVLGATAIAALGPLELTELIRLEPRADVGLLILSLIVLVVTATVAGLPAARRAASLDPVVALREE